MKKKEKTVRRETSQIPEFKSRAEAVRFWDTHDVADFQDDFKSVRARFNKRLSDGITIRFDPNTLEQLRLRAERKGMGPTTLARMWILERLAQER